MIINKKPPNGLSFSEVFIGAYLFFINILAMTVILLIWPGTATFWTNLVKWAAILPHLPSDLRILILAAFSGGLGSSLLTLHNFITMLGDTGSSSRWNTRLLAWYLARPFFGVPIGLLFYIFVRGGILKMTPEIDADVLNPYVVSGVAAMFGIFSIQIMEKLKDKVFAKIDVASSQLPKKEDTE